MVNEKKIVLSNIVVDEMSIKDKIEFDGKHFHGLVDMGSGAHTDSDVVDHATNVLVFLAVGVNGHWKLPLGYFLIKGLNGNERANLLRTCLELVFETGVIIHSITFDGAHSNLNMCTRLGAQFDLRDPKFYFPHPMNHSQPVYLFFDACHMIKLVRNTLGDKQILLNSNGDKIEWSFIKELYYKEKQEGLKVATKLSHKHVYYFNEKMNVKLAAQVLSTSVSNALTFCESLDTKFKNSKPTAEFCKLMNDAFDILNCRSKFSKSTYNQALSLDTYNKYLCFTKKFEEYVYGLTHIDGTRVVNSLRKTGFVGLVWGLKNLLSYYNLLKQNNYEMGYVLSYKLSQDHLETFFSSVRSRCGYNNNPSAKEFKTAYKKLLVHHHVSGSQYGNCLPESMLKNVSSNKLPDSILEIEQTNEELELLHYNDHINMYKVSAYVENVTHYIAGFVAKTVSQKINCLFCKQVLSINHTTNLLITLKDRNNALFKPSKDVEYICSVAEKWIRCTNFSSIYAKNFTNKLYIQIKSEVCRTVFLSKDMDAHIYGQGLFTNHRDQLLTLIITVYINLRLKHLAKEQQKPTVEVRKKLTKLILFRNE